MTPCTLHILGTIRDRMSAAVYSALENACFECGVSVSTSKIQSEIADHFQKNDVDYLLVDTVSLASIISETGFTPNSKTILIVFDRENPSLSAHLDDISGLRCLISGYSDDVLYASLKAIFVHAAEKKLAGIDDLLIGKAKHATITRSLENSSERSASQDAVACFFSSQIAAHQAEMASGISSYPKQMADVLDELLMNAIWDANRGQNMSTRTQVVSINLTEPVTLKASCDNKSLILNVTDSQGTFPSSIITRYIRYALGFRENTIMHEGTAGAGLGLYMILQKVTALSVEVERGKFTRVCAIIRGDQSLRDMQRLPRTILFLEI